ncbi:MAG: hypothetical protein EBS89_00225 [Proteobacteria bacterium]|nr:hypothetical protein [Pseudomonadota bacterium]
MFKVRQALVLRVHRVFKELKEHKAFKVLKAFKVQQEELHLLLVQPHQFHQRKVMSGSIQILVCYLNISTMATAISG